MEPYALINGREGWYVASFDPAARTSATSDSTGSSPRPAPISRLRSPPDVDPAADVDGWPRTGQAPSLRSARVWISPERARWAREERRVIAELADGALIVERGFAGLR